MSCVVTGQGAHWILAYAWHPLLATEVAGSGHIDIVGVLLLLVSFAALIRRWRAIAAVAFALAVAVKFLPVLLLPLYWRRIRIRDALLAAIVFALLYLPFLNHGRIPIGSLGTYIQSFRFNDPVFAALERVASPQIVVGLAALRRCSYRDLVQNQIADVVCGRIRMADGRVASMCAGRVSVVFALAAAVRAIGLDVADHHLDSKHYPHIHRLAPAGPWTSVGTSWLDYAAGVRIRRNHGCNHPVAPNHSTRAAVLNRLARVHSRCA